MLYFSTKAEVLQELSKIISTAKILPIFRFTVSDFEKNKNIIVSDIQQFFSDEKLIIRSSAKTEDNFETSNAGKYESILNIPKSNSDKISEAIINVIGSYDKYLESDEFLFSQC